MHNSYKNSRGQILVLVAISLVVLLGFAALAIDVGYFYHTKNQLQGAADAAALAGAALLTCENYDGSNAVQTTARNTAHDFALKNTASGQNVQTELNTGNDPNGDIVVGHWDGTNFTPESGAPLQIGARINAVKVVARRTLDAPVTGVKAGGNAVSTIFGKIFNVQTVNIKPKATASSCYDLSPIAANEYWMGDQGGMGGGGGNCNRPDYSNSNRQPYGINHVYPDSFVRPPAGAANGNVGSFPTLNCKGNPITVKANGPLTSACSSGTPECDGRPPGKPSAGRVFALVGGAAQPNNNGQMFGLANLDERVGYSNLTAGEQWYLVSGSVFNPEARPSTNPDKNIVAGYISSGKYPNDLPVAVTEVFQPGYTSTTLYTSTQPYASVSFFSGSGVAGQVVNDNFYDSGNFANGKYASGKKIIAAVYDGVVGGSGNLDRVTIVGFARFTIFGYGNKITLNSGGVPSVSGPKNTLYGYVENISDFSTDLPTLLSPGPASLVQ